MSNMFEIELTPVYLAEARARYGDIEAAVRDAIPWVITRLAIARSRAELQQAFDELDDGENFFRAILGCELLGMASSRPDVRAWLCEYLGRQELSDGMRYQLASAYSRLGVEARRAGRLDEAVALARSGLEAIADLPPCAVTATLYYNLGVALEESGSARLALGAYEDAVEIDEHLGRCDDADHARQRISHLRHPA